MESDSAMTISKGAKLKSVPMVSGSECGRLPLEAASAFVGCVLSIVVPVYKEEGNISEFLQRISNILSRITGNYEIIFCLDPSPDRTEAIILEHRQKDQRIKLLKFSRRVGQPM